MRSLTLGFLCSHMIMILLSCQTKIESVIYGPTGIVLNRVEMKNGKKEGFGHGYYENGKMKEVGQWVDDKQEGKWTYYYQSGNISAEAMFKNGVQDGETITYFENGQKKASVQLSNGAVNGIGYLYYTNGQIKKKSFFKDNKEIGQPTFFDSTAVYP